MSHEVILTSFNGSRGKATCTYFKGLWSSKQLSSFVTPSPQLQPKQCSWRSLINYSASSPKTFLTCEHLIFLHILYNKYFTFISYWMFKKNRMEDVHIEQSPIDRTKEAHTYLPSTQHSRGTWLLSIGWLAGFLKIMFSKPLKSLYSWVLVCGDYNHKIYLALEETWFFVVVVVVKLRMEV